MNAGEPLASRIASLVHTHFDGLPSRSKPTVRPDGTKEWIPMSGVVVVKGENTPAEKLTCVAVTSGAKCLSASQVPNCKGLVLHDWHAEILALRAFNYWLLSECRSILTQKRQHSSSSSDGSQESPFSPSSPYLRCRQQYPPFELQPDLTIYMYCTCAPCGDASMELCMAAQEDPTPWEANPDNPDESKLSLLDGRAHFSRLGIVRRKPARADAESTLSKSCSDKLALRQISSLLSYETSLLVAPTETAYLAGVILPENEVSSVGCARAFSDKGRMKVLKGRFWPLHNNSHSSPIPDQESSGYRFRPFRVLSIPMQKYASLWRYAKTGSSGTDAQEKRKPAVISAVWTVAPSGPPPSVVENGVKSLPVLRRSKTGLYETLINGVKQGNRVSTPLARGASALSRAKLWDTWREIVRLSCSGTDGEGNGLQGRHPAALSIPEPVVDAASYREFKKILPVVAQGMVAQGVVARKRAIQEAKDVLDGWISNARDEDWGLEVLVDPKKRKR